MSICEEPARKLFINQCLKIKPHDSGSQKKYRQWTIFFQGNFFNVGLVWIQGVIVNVSKSQNTALTLDDGTGTVTVVGANEAPGYGTWVTKGQYAMVIGELLATKPSVEIRAIKLTQLSETNAETLWILEVLDFWKHLES